MKVSSLKRETELQFGLLQAFYWCAVGTFQSFIQSFLLERGFLISEVGVVIALQTTFGFAGLLFWGVVSDRFRTNKGIYLLLNVVYMILSLLLFLANQRFTVYIYVSILGFVRIPMMAVLDTWMLKSLSIHNSQYGPIRSIGSLAFATITMFFGYAIIRYGEISMLVANEIFLLFSFVVAIRTKDIRSSLSNHAKPKFDVNSLRVVLQDRRILLLLLVLTSSGLAVSARSVLFPVIIQNAGGNIVHQGICLGVAALAEVPAMLMVGRIRTIKPLQIIQWLSALEVIAYIILAKFTSISFIVIAYGITGFCYGMIMPTRRKLIYSLAPIDIQTSVQSLSDAIYNCVAGALGSVVGGVFAEFAGISAAMTLICFILICVFFVQLVSNRKVFSNSAY